MRFRRRPPGLSQHMLYLARWYGLGQRPPSYSEMFLRAARSGWQRGLMGHGSDCTPAPAEATKATRSAEAS